MLKIGGGEGVKSVILTRKTAPHPMDVGRNRVRGGRRARDDARGGGEQGGEGTGRGRFPMGKRCVPKERRWRSVRRCVFSEGGCAFAAGKGRNFFSRSPRQVSRRVQWEREGVLCAHQSKRRNERKMRPEMPPMRTLQLPMRTLMMSVRKRRMSMATNRSGEGRRRELGCVCEV